MKMFGKLGTVIAALAMLVAGCANDTAPETANGDGMFTAGSYEASAEGYGGPLTLNTTFTADEIEAIEVVESSETADIGGAAIENLSEEVVNNQTLAIEAVSGATITSEAFIEAIENAVEQAGGDVESLKTAEGETEAEAVELETEVVVIGGGGAGLSAAVSAAQNGADVVVVEKTGALGGNTVRAGGPYNAVDPERQAAVAPADETSMEVVYDLTEVEPKNDRHAELQAELLADLEAYEESDQTSLFDSHALHKLQTYDGGDYLGDLEFIEKLVDDALPTSEWMADNGVVWTDDISTVPGGLWPRAHLPENAAGGDYIRASQETAEELGVEILLNSPAEELIVENEEVVGITGTSDGAPMTIRAQAVIIATGGFAANVEMRQEYDETLIDSLPTTNTPAATGDGIKMAEDVDAQLVGMDYIQSLPLGNPADGGLNAWVGGSGVEYYYQVNKDGVRFMAEDGRRDTMTQALLEQEDAMSYVISSADNTVEINDEGETIWGDDIEQLVEDGTIFRADTIEELAEQIDIDPAVLQDTHDTFNSYVESGNDEDFGRTLFGEPLVTGPFYASPRVPTVHHTMGGLSVNLNSEALNGQGEPIPGLYAAGEVTGNIHGSNRLGGNALVDIHVFGRVAGESAANSLE
jgi:fumarate reductase flavoprotein subunit